MKITLSDLLELLGAFLIVGAVASWNAQLGVALVGLVVIAVGYVLGGRAPELPGGPES